MERLAELCLVFLYLSFISGNSASINPEAPVKTFEDPSISTPLTKDALVDTADVKDDDGMEEELLSSETAINGKSVGKGDRKLEIASGDIDATSSTIAEFRSTTNGVSSLRRQGEVTPALKTKQTGEGIKQNLFPRFAQNSGVRNTAAQDANPVLQLTQGGYQRPYYHAARLRDRQISRPNSSEQPEKLEKLEESSNASKESTLEKTVPQVTYTNLKVPLTPYGSGPVFEQSDAYGPILRSTFQEPHLNQGPGRHISVQDGVLKNPPASISDYTSPDFRSQLARSNEIGYVSFSGEPNNVVLYHPAQQNPFQNAGLLFQGVSQPQQQPFFINSARNIQPQLQFDPMSSIQGQSLGHISPTYPNSDNADGNSENNFASFFSNPIINSRFQLPANYYGPNANGGIRTPNSQPVMFLSNYPYPEDRLSSRFLRYPSSPSDLQSRQNVNQNINAQQQKSDTSQENQKAKGSESKDDKNAADSDNILRVPFGTRLQDQNQDDFYIKYPTNEAGYAIKENLPPQNGSQLVQYNVQLSPLDRGSFLSNDPYKVALNAVRNQSQSRTQHIPEKLFNSIPTHFEPQNQIFLEHPNRNRHVAPYQTPDFDPRALFNPQLPPSENSYPFVNSANPRRSHPVANEAVPSCAKQKNVSFCFEDDEYPRNDILYSINSNSYLADRLFGSSLDLKQLESAKQDSSDQTPEQYACRAYSESGSPLRAKNVAGIWRIVVNVGHFSQPLKMEICRSTGDPCSYANHVTETSCEQKFNRQRLLTWSSKRGLVADVFKIPVACSCRILQAPTV